MTQLNQFKSDSKTISFDYVSNDCSDRGLSKRIDRLLANIKLTRDSRLSVPISSKKNQAFRLQVLQYLHNPDLGHYLEDEFYLDARLEDNQLVVG
jgi:hypothetical protein